VTVLAAKEAKPAHAARGMRRSSSKPIGPENRIQRKAIRQLIQTDGIQAKLTIGKPNDAYEQEADRVADHVVAGQMAPVISTIPSGGLSSAGAGVVSPQLQSQADNEEQVQEKEIQREEEDELAQTSLIQRQAEEEEGSVQARFIQRQPEEEEKPLQARFIQRQPEEEKEPVQASLIQRQAGEEEAVQAKGSPPSPALASQTIQKNSGGSPMRPDIRNILESNMGADLSGVRVHEDSSAHKAASSINAKAFTHKNNIWLGEGQSQSDVHLMAHEATHVVQQGGGLRTRPVEISQISPRVQGLWNPISAISNAVSSAAEWVGDSLGAAIDYIKEKAAEFARAIPGYSLLAVVLGEDPISGRAIERNGINFIEAGLQIIPGGSSLKQKLEEEGKLAEAAQWLDKQINALDVSPAEIGAQLSRFWSGLSLSDATHLGDTLERLANIIRGPIDRIFIFAGNVASKLLQIVKDAVISSLINFIKEHTTAYPLLTVILGRDPISGEVVERTPIALLRGFMQLSESGAAQLAQMEESGSLQRAADWLDGAVARLNLSWEMLVAGFRGIWDSLGIQRLMDPGGVFQQIYDTFAAPVGRIINFLIEVAVKVLGFIKDALISRLITYARTVRGYPLLTVILGQDPFSEAPVERSAENIIHGFMSLMDGGEEQFQEMKQTGAIARMTDRIEGALATLNFTWEYIRGLFLTAWNAFSLADLAAPIAAFGRLLAIFGAPLLRLIGFIVTVVRMVIEVALQLMHFPVALISNIITRSMQAFDNIKRDPIGFLKNLLRAVKTGFVKFFSNIATHLLNGLTGWLFGELEDAGISPPPDLSFKSILGLVIQVLGISVDRIFQKLADRIGQERVDRIRGMMDRLTGIWAFVSDVMTRGPVAIWEYIQERLSNLWSTVLEAVRNWVVTRIIQQVTARLLSMLDPTGIMAVVNGFIAFYNAVQSFVRYLTEMLEVVNSFVEGVAEIAAGSVESAANFLEGALGRTMPIVIGFLANQVGLSGLGRRIGEMIERVRAMVDQGLDWLIDRAVSAGTSFMNMGRNALGTVRDWWRASKRFSTPSGGEHTLYFEGQGHGRQLMMRSTPQYYQSYLNNLDVPEEKRGTKSSAMEKAVEIDTILRQSDEQNPPNETELSTKLDELSVFTAELDISSDGAFNPSYGSLTSVGFGTSVRVNTLSKNENGSHVNQGYVNGNAIFRTLKARRQGGASYYVAGHLLNNNLGGPGNNWGNLTPLTQYANTQDHEPNFERNAKDAVINEEKTVDFIVNANYGTHDLAISKVEELRASGDDVKADVIEAERNVPTTLDCSVIEVAPTRGNLIKTHTVQNTIDTNLDNYDLEGIPAERVYLLDMSKSDLMGLNGVNKEIAERIIQVKNENSIRRWNTLERLVPGASKDTIRSTVGRNVLLFRVNR